ncbi:MAG: hypothetical protein H7145_05805 [Akkermansiaceae bacterium]|nr:hypothetical protein [Armatimonadota bacterium]
MTVALEPLLPPIPAMLLVLVVLGGLMLGLRTLQHRRRIHPELSRKMLHVGMGFVTLTFPWLFGTAMWPVVLLGVLASASLYTLRRSSWLRERFGGVLHGVSRDSLGEIYFPVGVAGLFFLADGDTVSYIIPVLLLALGDAVAALIGVRYGSLKYETGEGQKSLEGSLAFLLVAFLSAHVPLLLATNTGRAESLLIGLILGLLLTLIEAVAWRGLDNLFIPLGAFLLLRSFLPLGVLDLLVRLGVTLALVGFAVLYRRQTTLNSGAVLGSALIAYLAWALGGWQWMVAPITLFSTYALLFPRENRDGTSRTHDISDVLRATGVGISWLFLAAAYDRPDFLLPYTVSFAAHLAIIGIIRLQERFNRNEEGLVTAVAVIKSALLMLVPYYLCAGPNSRPALVTLLVLAPVGTIVGIAGAHLSGIVPGDNPLKYRRWVLQLGVAIGSALTAKGIAPW